MRKVLHQLYHQVFNSSREKGNLMVENRNLLLKTRNLLLETQNFAREPRIDVPGIDVGRLVDVFIDGFVKHCTRSTARQ